MGDLSFTWRGISSDEYGVVVTSLPAIMTPQARDETFPVPGRNGSLHVRDGAYEEMCLMIGGYLPYGQEGATVTSIETIKSWLTGDGWLTLSDLPDRRYKGRIIDSVSFSPLVIGFPDRIFQVGIWCDPLAYEAETRIIALNGAHVFENPGTAAANPTIRVAGTGDLSVTVGEVTVSLTGMVSGTEVVIDTENRVAYRSGSNAAASITLDDHMWPVLALGETRVMWSGSVSKITVEPNWRWI